MARDFTVPDNLCQITHEQRGMYSTHSSSQGAQTKSDKYATLCSTSTCYLFAVETSGMWHSLAIDLISSALSLMTSEKQRCFSSVSPWLSRGGNLVTFHHTMVTE